MRYRGLLNSNLTAGKKDWLFLKNDNFHSSFTQLKTSFVFLDFQGKFIGENCSL